MKLKITNASQSRLCSLFRSIAPVLESPKSSGQTSFQDKRAITGLWTEVCVTWPNIEVIGAGYNIDVVEDCCAATTTPEAGKRDWKDNTHSRLCAHTP